MNFKVLLITLVLVLAAALRLYQLDAMPPSLNWDEAAAAYNSWAIANYGKDEYGKKFPLVFRNFGDDKHPVHIYTTALFIKILGTNDFTVRLPSAFLGVMSVLLLFLIVNLWFKNFYLGLLSGFVLSISPYHIHFSRGLWEVNFALFYFLLGLYGFFKGIEKRNWWVVVGFVGFGLSLLSYHSSKVVVLPVVILLSILYIKDLLAVKKLAFLCFGVFLFFALLIALNPALLGTARVQQTKFSEKVIENTEFFKKTNQKMLGYAEVVAQNYIKHFDLNYLFVKGDQSPRNSVKTFGMFYKADALFIIIGLIIALWNIVYKKSKVFLVALVWLLLSPLPSSFTDGAPNATRAMFMMGSLHILSALGIYTLINAFKKIQLRVVLSLLVIGIFVASLSFYLREYYGKYESEAIQWQYGMKEIVEFVASRPDYARVYMTDVRSQPYIFFLYYLKVPPDKLQETVIYNDDIRNKSYNLIYSFDRYQFGGWDEIQSQPYPGVLYIIEEGKYGGLAHKDDFYMVKSIKFPGGDIAFYMVSPY